MIGRLLGEALPTVHLAHRDLARSQQGPEQHRFSLRRGQHGLGLDPPLELFVQNVQRSVPIGHRRRDAGRQEGVRRSSRRRPREHAILEGDAPRSETTGAYDRARARGCRRCTRVVERARGGLAKDARPRCWVHKTANVLNKLPKSQQAKAKRAAETKKDALVAFHAFVEIYDIKYEKAVECLTKDRDALLAFYDFPTEHWMHLRTSNPVESTFATVRYRTVCSKGCLSNKTALVQACSSRRETLASPRWTKPVAKGHSRRKVYRRNRGCKRRSSNCRLTSLVTNIRT